MSAAANVELAPGLRVSVDAQALARAVRDVAPVAAKRAPMPVLSQALLRVTAGVISVRACDLRVDVAREVVTSSPFVDGAVCVPPAVLARVLRGARGLVVLDRVGTGLVVTVGTMRFTLDGLDPEAFPDAAAGLPLAGELPAADLARALGLVSYAMASDTTRPHLECVRLAVEGGRLDARATDGHRLAAASRRVASPDLRPMLLPTALVIALRRMLGAEPAGSVEVRRSGATAVFRFAGGSVGGVLHDVAFPPFENVIPPADRNTTRAVVDTSALRRAIDAGLRACGTSMPAVGLTLRAGEIVVETFAVVEECRVHAPVPAEVTGPEVRIGINARYVADALRPLRGERVTLGVAGSLDPVTIRSRTNYTAVVMPARV